MRMKIEDHELQLKCQSQEEVSRAASFDGNICNAAYNEGNEWLIMSMG